MSSYQQSLFTLLGPLTVFFSFMFFVCSPASVLILLAYSSQLGERKEKGGEERMKESERKLGCWLCRFCLGGTPASRIHHALMLMAVTDLQTHSHPIPHPPLSQHGKGDLTQKWVETNDSNEFHCPPANVCRYYCCPCKWLQMAVFSLANCCSPSLNKCWEGDVSARVILWPLCPQKQSDSFFSEGLINRSASSVVFESDTKFKGIVPIGSMRYSTCP